MAVRRAGLSPCCSRDPNAGGLGRALALDALHRDLDAIDPSWPDLVLTRGLPLRVQAEYA